MGERFLICRELFTRLATQSVPDAPFPSAIGDYLFLNDPGFVRDLPQEGTAGEDLTTKSFWDSRLRALHQAATRIFFQRVADDRDFLYLLEETAPTFGRWRKAVLGFWDKLKDSAKGRATSGVVSGRPSVRRRKCGVQNNGTS